MEIIDRSQIKRFVNTIIFVSSLLIVIPLAAYIINFGTSSFSSDTSDWGTFGDYFGGLIGTFFSVIAAFFSLVSIFITMRIASSIQAAEHAFNEANSIRETERFEKEIDLTKRQNKPFPYLDLTKHPASTTITLCNYGIGPLVVNKLSVIYRQKEEYRHFQDFISNKIPVKMEKSVVIYNTAPTHILSPNTQKELASILPIGEISAEFFNFQASCRDHLKDCTLFIRYQDIFENETETTFTLEFLGNE